MKQSTPWHKTSSFREWLLNLCGYEIWPPTHNDPRINGPQPRIITKRQADALRAMAEVDLGEQGGRPAEFRQNF